VRFPRYFFLIEIAPIHPSLYRYPTGRFENNNKKPLELPTTRFNLEIKILIVTFI